jgi:hydroxypyruvate isomerase
VNSPRFKLLFDIYHMQIMEGDLIATIQKNIQHIGHFHTAGVPGRHELDENQEINYPAVMRAIAGTGYQGYVAHEYNPVGDALASLVQAAKACDV